MVWLRRGLWAALVAVVLYSGWRLAAENSAPVTVSYVYGEVADVQQWRVLLVAFASGVGLASLFLVYQIVKGWLMRRSYRRRIAALESEVHQLRNLPLSGEVSAARGPELRSA